MRSRLIVLGLAVVVVIVAIVASSGGGGGAGGGGGFGRLGAEGRSQDRARLLAREGEAARPADPQVQRPEEAGRRQAAVRRGQDRVLWRRREADREGPAEADRLVAVILVLGPAREPEQRRR